MDDAGIRLFDEAAVSLALAGALWWMSGAVDLGRSPGLAAADAARLWDDAIAAREEDRYPEALRAVQRLLVSFPHDPRSLSLEADALEHIKRPGDAARAWELYAESAPFPTEACPNLGRDYENAGDPEGGLSAYRRCLALEPSKVDLMVMLGLALDRAGHDAEAEALLNQARIHAPNDRDATTGLAHLLYKRGDLDGADVLTAATLNRDPANTDALVVAAQIALARKNYPQARGYLERALVSSPTYLDVYRLLLRAQNAQGDFEAAAKTRSRLVELQSAAKKVPE